MNAHRVTIDYRALLRGLRDNVLIVVIVAVALLIVVIMWQPTPDPSFACSKGKHWDMRYVGDVATLGCFE
jgi:hypothetical protein